MKSLKWQLELLKYYFGRTRLTDFPRELVTFSLRLQRTKDRTVNVHIQSVSSLQGLKDKFRKGKSSVCGPEKG